MSSYSASASFYQCALVSPSARRTHGSSTLSPISRCDSHVKFPIQVDSKYSQLEGTAPYRHLLLAPAECWWPSAPPIPPPCRRHPPYPLHWVFFYPHFFIGGPSYTPSPAATPPIPCTQFLFFYFFLCGHLGCKKAWHIYLKNVMEGREG